jgi:hypothetical protein
MKRIIFVLASLSLAACASRSVLPDVKEVKVSREEPSPKCREIGKLTGTASSSKGTREESLEDLKKETANKGGNYVVVKQYSDYGTAVTGIAYECP